MAEAKLILKLVAQTVVWLGAMAVLLFAAAGNWLWPQAWAFAAIFVLGSIGFSIWLLPRDPALLESRLKPLDQPGQPLWDRIFLLFFIALWFVWLVLMAFDAQRWRSSHVPVALNVLGGVLIVVGFTATVAVLRENSYAAPAVRIQKERGQHVIDTGPYALVRHPMYAAAIPYLVGIPLLLGSWYGLIGSAIILAGVSVRSIFEEKKLARELPGYADYMTRVRHRLIPGVW